MKTTYTGEELADAIATLTHIRDDAGFRLAALEGTGNPLRGSYCVYCGATIDGANGLEECPVRRYVKRVSLSDKQAGNYAVAGPKQGEVHGDSHLWSAGHVEIWFNYSGPRGAEKGWPEK